jgi:hypothetical protein
MTKNNKVKKALIPRKRKQTSNGGDYTIKNSPFIHVLWYCYYRTVFRMPCNS